MDGARVWVRTDGSDGAIEAYHNYEGDEIRMNRGVRDEFR